VSGKRRGAAIVGAVLAVLVAASVVGCSNDSSRSAPAAAGPVTNPVEAVAIAVPGNPARPSAHRATQAASAACAGTPSGVRHIYVSISKQHLWACTGPVLLIGTAVTTGASALTNVHDATPTGTWRTYAKVRNTVLAGRDANGSWYDHVAYWMPFYLGYGFHDSSWQTFPYGSSLYKTKGSHGCIHVPVAALRTIFNWAPVGTLITIRS
jgi:hypothetical protein